MRFILSLCVSDLISALISWLFLYRRTWGFDVWSPIPNIFCKVSLEILQLTSNEAINKCVVLAQNKHLV